MISTYLKTVFESFYSHIVYRDVYRKWHGYGLKYLFIVTIISSLLIAASWGVRLSKISSNQMADAVMNIIISDPSLSFEENLNRFINILSQIPEIKIENGRVKTAVQQPYFIAEPGTNRNIAIIDTTGNTKSLENTDAKFLLSDSKMLIKNGNNESVMYFHEFEKNYNLDQDTLNDVVFVISQIPEFGLYSGKIKTADNKLYKIYDTEDRELAQIGDGASLTEKALPMLAISESAINFKNIFNRSVYSIKADELNEQRLLGIINSGFASIKKIMLWGVLIIVLPLMILSAFLFNSIMLVFYAFIGHSFIKIMKWGEFEFREIMRIAAVSITPVLLISVFLPKIIPSQGTVYFIISIGYLYYAIKAVTNR